MNSLPEPLTPADCNLRGLPFMPMMVSQVMQSDTFGLSTGDEFKAAFALWCASWMQLPAASLPNDDRMLAYLSHAKAWKKVKTMALRGWVLCSDGRLYHAVIAASAIEAWDKRTEYRDKEDSKNDRQQRWREQCKQLSGQLREVGIVPPKGASLNTLRGLLEAHIVDAQTSTNVDAEPPTVDAGEMPKRETERERGRGRETVNIKPVSSSQDSIDVREPEHPSETMPIGRNVQISLLLRAQGVLATAANPIVAVTFATDPRVTDDVLNVAIAKAKAAKPGEQIPVKYLQRVIESDLNAQAKPVALIPAPQKGDPGHWQQSAAGIEAMGKSIGMQKNDKELHRDYAARIQIALDQRKGQQ